MQRRSSGFESDSLHQVDKRQIAQPIDTDFASAADIQSILFLEHQSVVLQWDDVDRPGILRVGQIEYLHPTSSL